MLKCGKWLPNDAIMGELGWMTMRGRHMLLRLSSCSKILAMEDGRWVKKVYEHGRRRLEKGGRANTWCNLTRKWLRDLGLEEEWKQQAVGPAWQERLKEKIMEYEARNWRRRVVREDNVKLKDYGKWKTKPELEQYLQHEDVHQRRLWTKLRGGILELRVETGRWERMSLGGRQERVPRRLRRCKLCFGEVEDARHVLFRCPAYGRQREVMAVEARAQATPRVVGAMESVVRGKNSVAEEELLRWMMVEGGEKVGMEVLDRIMKVRAKLLGE